MVSKQLIPSNSGANQGLPCSFFCSCCCCCCCWGGFPCSATAPFLSSFATQALIHSCAFPFSLEMSAAELKTDMDRKNSIAPEVNYKHQRLGERERERERMQQSLLCAGVTRGRSKRWCSCSAIAVDAPSSATSVSGIRWGSSKLQGLRTEMEDDVVIRADGLGGFTFAAVFDGHAGSSSVEFLRHELYKECVTALQAGSLLGSKNFSAIQDVLCGAFQAVDAKLLSRLDEMESEDDSGSTATVIFVRNDIMIISHIGDSCVAISRTGKAEVVTNPHRPYGNNKVSLEEVKRIRAAGGWIVDGRICGEISVSRAFGDMRFKTKKNEMLEKGIKEGRWNQKFASRIQFKGDLVTAVPDIYQVDLGADAEFILLASDGLWDYIKSNDAVAFVRNQLRQHGDVQQACEALAREALGRRSEDNVSIVIADLGRTDWQNLPVQGPNFFIEIGQAFATVGVVSLGIWISSLLSL